MSAPKIITVPAIFHWIDESSTERTLRKIETRTEVVEEPGIRPWEIKRKPGKTVIIFHFTDGSVYVVDRAKVPPVDYTMTCAEAGAPVHIIINDVEDNVIYPKRLLDE